MCTGGDSRPAHAGIYGTFICGFTPERDGEGMNEIAAHAGSGAENIRKTAAVATSTTACISGGAPGLPR